MKGKLIVIEGLDGSGKATQSQKLYGYLKNKGVKVRKISFPDYESDSSALIKMYLAGEFGSDANSVNPYAASSFYAVDRYASYKKDWGDFYNDGGIIIADRYTTSNAIHQCAKLPDSEWEKFLEWLYEYEFNYLGIPAPDCIIYLDVEPDVSQELMSKRYNGNESKKDIHEKDIEYLKQCRRSADYCINSCNGLEWMYLSCCSIDNKGKYVMRSIDEIFEDVRYIAESIIAYHN